MPLSEHEQHLLEQMEQALYAEDPKFASQMVTAGARSRLRRRIIVGVVVALLGLVLVVLALTNQVIWLGGVGFAVMVAGAGWAITPPRAPAAAPLGAVGTDGKPKPRATRVPGGSTSSRSGHRSSGRSSSAGFMARLEERWDRRRGGGGWS